MSMSRISGVAAEAYPVAWAKKWKASIEARLDRSFSGYLHQRVKEGEELDIAAPAGRFTFTGTEANSILLIGGGVGITPLMSVIRYLTAHGWPGEIVLLYCFREPKDFIFREELEYLQRRNPNLRVIAAATRRGRTPWLGQKAGSRKKSSHTRFQGSRLTGFICAVRRR